MSKNYRGKKVKTEEFSYPLSACYLDQADTQEDTLLADSLETKIVMTLWCNVFKIEFFCKS